MKKAKNLLFLFFLLLSSPCIFAQQEQELPQERKDEFGELSKRKIDDLLEFIKQITDSSLPMKQRINAIDSAMRLFIDTYTDENGKERKPIIQISTKNGEIHTRTLKEYFNGLLKLKFEQVKISKFGATVISDFEKGIDGKYHATGYYFQDFKGLSNGKLIYHSQDKKKVSITGESLKVYSDINQVELKVFLVNITVDEFKNNPIN